MPAGPPQVAFTAGDVPHHSGCGKGPRLARAGNGSRFSHSQFEAKPFQEPAFVRLLNKEAARAGRGCLCLAVDDFALNGRSEEGGDLGPRSAWEDQSVPG